MKKIRIWFDCRKTMIRTGLLLILISFLSLEGAKYAQASSWQQEMLNTVNVMRSKEGVAPLRICKEIQKAAQNYASYMARENFYSHKGKDGSNVGDRLTQAGYRWRSAKSGSFIGENIAAGQTSVVAVMNDWAMSPSHRSNILNRNFTHVGFGRAQSRESKFGVYWVQNFGSGVRC
jgi:uncharacterized protein YkwD